MANNIGFSPFHFILILIGLALFIGPFFMIFKKAGYSGAIAFLMLIPGVAFILIWWFALADWPIRKPKPQFPPQP